MKVRNGLFLVLAMGLAVSTLVAQTSKPAPVRGKAQKNDTAAVSRSGQPQRMTFDFKDTDIRDVVRSISIAYGLNIIIDKDVSTKVTIHLTDVPVLEGLRTLLGAHGLALQKEGDIYRIIKAEDKGKGAI
ncbi:MAG: secretin and TonB N-terminal domain-containing protein, partial [Chitinispirillaceae bacterium]|nr:secretin and TonB N-terminal domain-containing protein [Chitinispirillaceae bacterium]